MNNHRILLVSSVVALALSACKAPEPDDFRSGGGAARDPFGIVDGTITYIGPRPVCGSDGAPLGRVVLTMFAYDNPPPPSGSATSALNMLTVPGTELFKANEDCLPLPPTPEDLAVVVMRSAPFTWPEVALGAGRDPAHYQVRGFYDNDADFNPFFSATNLPTAGDVVGGAFENLVASPLTFRDVELPGASSNDGRLGARVAGITVTLVGPVTTERPYFYLEEDGRTMAAGASFPGPLTADLAPNPAFQAEILSMIPAEILQEIGRRRVQATEVARCWTALPGVHPLKTADMNGNSLPDVMELSGGLDLYADGLESSVIDGATPFAVESLLLANSNTKLVMYGENEELDDPFKDLMRDLRLGVDTTTRSKYQWSLATVDADLDGAADPHPVFGTLDDSDPENPIVLDWVTPLTIFKRVRSAAETQIGVPDVMFIGTPPLMDVVLRNEDPRVVPIGVPPALVAAITGLGATLNAVCVGGGTWTEALEWEADWTYAWTIAGHGTAFYPDIDIIVPPAAIVDLDPSKGGACRVVYLPPGGTVDVYESPGAADPAKDCQELPTGLYSVSALHGAAVSSAGSSFSGQAWTIPNELGPRSALGLPDQVESPLPEQGVSGMFVVHDATPDDFPATSSDDERQLGCTMAFDQVLYAEDPTNPVRPIVWKDPSAMCCEAVEHLCAVPICPTVPYTPQDGADPVEVRMGTTIGDDGTPSCIPFPIPLACCPTAD